MPENKKADNDDKVEHDFELAVKPPASTPETSWQMINSYGTYNIQPTSNTPNDFPAIAQDTPDYMSERSHKFFRDGNDKNPAHNTSDRKPL